MPSLLYDAAWVGDTLARLADEIAANRAPGEPKTLVGLRTRGAVLADRLRSLLARKGLDLPIGYLDATVYRDDLHTGAGLRPVGETDLPFAVRDRAILLVDDVLSTGRTVRAAMEALFAHGRPGSVRLCVMLDRGGRQLPVQADFVGGRVEVPRGGWVRLKLAEVDPQGDAVYLVPPGDGEP